MNQKKWSIRFMGANRLTGVGWDITTLHKNKQEDNQPNGLLLFLCCASLIDATVKDSAQKCQGVLHLKSLYNSCTACVPILFQNRLRNPLIYLRRKVNCIFNKQAVTADIGEKARGASHIKHGNIFEFPL